MLTELPSNTDGQPIHIQVDIFKPSKSQKPKPTQVNINTVTAERRTIRRPSGLNALKFKWGYLSGGKISAIIFGHGLLSSYGNILIWLISNSTRQAKLNLWNTSILHFSWLLYLFDIASDKTKSIMIFPSYSPKVHSWGDLWSSWTELYLRFQPLILLDNGVIVQEEGVIGRLEEIVVLLKLLSLPPSSAVLEPNSHLPRLQSKLLCQLDLLLRFQLVLLLEALLQQINL